MQIAKIAVIVQVVLGGTAAAVALTRPSASEKVATAKAAQKAHEASEAAHDAPEATHGATGHGEGGALALGAEPKEIAHNLLLGNARFVAGQSAHHDLAAQRTESAKGQHPPVMVLGCADSRVSPELIMDRGIGELFVVRSAGNIAEPVAVGSLEYAVDHLHAKVLVVLGHEKCGAVQAALAGEKMPSPNLDAVVGHIAPGVLGLKAWAEGPALVHMAVEANVERQAQELLKASAIIRKEVNEGRVSLLKAVYDVETGRVRPLP